MSAFPSLDYAPLHSRASTPLCEMPEYPWRPGCGVTIDFRCRACRLGARASLLNLGDCEMKLWAHATQSMTTRTLSDLLDQHDQLEANA